MRDIQHQKQKAVNRIEKLSTVFAIATLFPAVYGMWMRMNFADRTPRKLNARELDETHPLYKKVKELAEPLGIKARVKIADEEYPLQGGFMFPMARDNNIGPVTEICMVFVGNPALTSKPDTYARALVAHELGHVQQFNSKFCTFTRANMRSSLFIAAASTVSMFENPAFLPLTATYLALSLGFTYLAQKEEKLNEYLADLRGAKILKSYSDAIIGMNYLFTVNSDIEKAIKNTPLKTLFSYQAFTKHPDNNNRLNVLRIAKAEHEERCATQNYVPK